MPRMMLPVLLALLSAHAVQAQETVGNVRFEAPKGWVRDDLDAAVLLVPPGVPEGQQCALILVPGRELEGDFRAAFDAVRKELEAGRTLLGGGEVKAIQADEGYDALVCVVVLQATDGKVEHRFYIAAHPGDRFEILIYSASTKQLFDEHLGEVERLSQTLAFASQAAARPAVDGPLEGLYYGEKLVQRLNIVSNTYEYVRDRRYYYFFPDGRVHFGLPQQGGLTDFDFEEELKSDPDRCGTYRLDMGRIAFRWGGKDEEHIHNCTRSENGLAMDGFKLCRMGATEGLLLAGTWSFQSGADVSSTFGSKGLVAGETTITFDVEGRFTEEGFVGWTVKFDGPVPAPQGEPGTVVPPTEPGQAETHGSSKAGGSGTYRIRKDTLELAYSDGRRRRLSFLLFPGNGSTPTPRIIMIDGVTYLLRE